MAACAQWSCESVRAGVLVPIPGDVRDGHGWKSSLMEPGVGVSTFGEGFVGQCIRKFS